MMTELSGDRLTVIIFGEQYHLKSNGNAELLAQVAREIDATMCQLSESVPGGTLAVHQIAVLAALKITSERLNHEHKILSLIDQELIERPAL